jgi:hypothetical protein
MRRGKTRTLELKEPPMDAAVAGLIGGLIGAGASLLGLVIQQHFQAKRERMKIAADLGLVEYQRDLELAKVAGGGNVAPLSAYVISHARLLEEMSKGPITPDTVKALTEERNKVLAAFPNAPEN